MTDSKTKQFLDEFSVSDAELRRLGVLSNTALISNIFDQISDLVDRGVPRKVIYESLVKNEVIDMTYHGFLSSYYRIKNRYQQPPKKKPTQAQNEPKPKLKNFTQVISKERLEQIKNFKPEDK